MDIALHALIALLAFIAALVVEHFRVPILSRVMFWARRNDLIGTYSTTWITTTPVRTTDADEQTVVQSRYEDLVRIEWASGSYVSGTASNASYGDYVFQGRAKGDAVTLTYRSSEKRLEGHLGAIMLRMQGPGLMAGHWMQNKPDQSVVFLGTTTWTKRPT